MDTLYTYTEILGIEKADYNGNVTIKYIMEILQKISTDSANKLGFGHNLVRSNNLAWVLNKLKIKFFKPIKMGDKITFYTWPIAPKHFTADRDYKAVDSNGDIVFVGTSVWNLIDLTKRSLTNTEIVKDIKVDYLQDRAIPENTYSRFRFSPDFKLDYEKTIRLSEIDINNHVNNTNYYSYSQDTLSKEEYDKKVVELEIKFNQELHLGETLQIYSFKQNNIVQVIGRKEDKDVFSTQLILND